MVAKLHSWLTKLSKQSAEQWIGKDDALVWTLTAPRGLIHYSPGWQCWEELDLQNSVIQVSEQVFKAWGMSLKGGCGSLGPILFLFSFPIFDQERHSSICFYHVLLLPSLLWAQKSCGQWAINWNLQYCELYNKPLLPSICQSNRKLANTERKQREMKIGRELNNENL